MKKLDGRAPALGELASQLPTHYGTFVLQDRNQKIGKSKYDSIKLVHSNDEVGFGILFRTAKQFCLPGLLYFHSTATVYEVNMIKSIISSLNNRQYLSTSPNKNLSRQEK
jgi:hypothetical protein